jgi:sulfatase maturation enzyme AslB (radical SAM superfamily)
MAKSLWWVTTRLCQLACPSCYQGADHAGARVDSLGLTRFMPKSVLDKALPWALQWAGDELQITLYGGEPLLAWPLIRAAVPEWIAAFEAAGKKVRFSCTTNGALLRKQEIRDFFDRYKIGLLFSLDGTKRTHDTQRVLRDGSGTWDLIDPVSIIKWRPETEIAWTLSAGMDFRPDDIDELLALGFKKQNYNINWLTDWSAEEQLKLQRFFKRAGRLMAQGKLESYWKGKYIKAGTSDKKMEKPCGLATGMLALTPEGYIYGSQELAFTVFEPERAKGTAEYYRVGNVAAKPVLDPFALARVGILKTADMKPKPEFSCEDCVAKSACIGSCHCRLVGSEGFDANAGILPSEDPGRRTDVPRGYCQSLRSAMFGLIGGFWIERDCGPKERWEKKPMDNEAQACHTKFPERTWPAPEKAQTIPEFMPLPAAVTIEKE